MNLVLQREVLSDKSTIGELSINGEKFCFTLEDAVRFEGDKIYGKTAIPVGTFAVVITNSQHFKRPLPLLLNVPSFEGVRIHVGNFARDTDGCILIGMTKEVDFIGQSQRAMDLFMPKLEAALQDGQEVWIDVRNPMKDLPRTSID